MPQDIIQINVSRPPRDEKRFQLQLEQTQSCDLHVVAVRLQVQYVT